MCTFLPYPETIFAEFTFSATAREQVDEVMKCDREFQEKKAEIASQPGADLEQLRREIGVYVWLDSHCYGNGRRGFYYVRYHHPSTWRNHGLRYPRADCQEVQAAPRPGGVHGAQMQGNQGGLPLNTRG